MKLWVLKKECMMILILDTNGVLPTKMQRDLMLCRSLTLPADYLLMGPVQLGKCPIFWCIEPEGKRISGDMQAAAAFCACLAAAGYGAALTVSDGYRSFSLQQSDVRQWRAHGLSQGQLAWLLSVDQSCLGASTISEGMRLRKSSPSLGSP